MKKKLSKKMTILFCLVFILLGLLLFPIAREVHGYFSNLSTYKSEPLIAPANPKPLKFDE